MKAGEVGGLVDPLLLGQVMAARMAELVPA